MLRCLIPLALVAAIPVVAAGCGRIGYGPLELAAEDGGAGWDAGEGDGARIVDVGSFTVVPGASLDQVVSHALGATPAALLLWTSATRDVGVALGGRYSMGVTDGTITRSVSIASDDGVTASDSSRQIAGSALTVMDGSRTTLGEATFVRWDPASFVLRWDVAPAEAWTIHYMLIGGDGVQAAVVPWNTPTAVGPAALAGTRLRPDVVFHFSAGDSYDVFDSSVGAARFGFGAMGATGEWSVGVAVLDGQTPNLARRGQRPDVGFSVLDRTSYAREAALASFDADGFTLDHTEVSSSSAVVFSLAVAGVKTALGSFQKVVAPAPATQSVTGLAFQPEAVLFASVQDEAQPAIVVDAAFGLGVATSHAAGAVAYHDVDGVSPTRVQRIGATDTAFVALGAGGIEAEAELTSLDADGFTLTWRRNDAHATNISYCALAPAGR